MFQLRKTCLALSLLLFPFLSLAQLSASKLSAHLINAYTVGSSNIVSAQPRTLKVLALDSGFPTGMLQAMRDYKSIAPNGNIVVRIYTPTFYNTNHNPTASASAYWTIMSNALNTISVADRALIDFLEGPNEGDTPTLGYPHDNALFASQWFNQFWTNLTPKIVAAGYKPCIGSIAVGNPSGTTEQMQNYLAAFVPALRQVKAAGGAWSYHAYTINYTTDIVEEIYFALRYRQFYSYFAQAFPDLTDMPLLLTEGGVDFSGDPSTSGWQARGTADDYKRWLNWFDQQMAQDSYVIGCQLFQNGDPGGWSSFDLEPIAGWLKNYLLAPTNVPPAPSGLTAIAGTESVTLTWTNAPLHPTTYKVIRSQISGGIYLVVATNIATGVTGVTFTDNSVTNGGTYFYRVLAINAFGESGASTEISAVIAPLPDVTITTLLPFPVSGGFYAGNEFLFRAIVKNQGAAATPTGPGKGIGIGFSLDDGAFFSYHGANINYSLGPGATAMLSADGPEGNFTWIATPGFHSLTATVDDINRFSEVNENNNSATQGFNVGLRINSGGSTAGSSYFLSDRNFSGGMTFSTNTLIDSSLIVGTSGSGPQSVYQTERTGNFSYTLTNLIPDTTYALRLHFAELIYTNIGQRVFNVAINGALVLTNFDIFAEAEAQHRSLAKRFHVSADSNGQINLQFTSIIGAAKLSGIDLTGLSQMPNGSPTFLPISHLVVNANSPVNFTVRAVDPDQPAQSLTYDFLRFSEPPAGATLNPTNGIFAWTPSAAQAGVHSIHIQVTDGFLVTTKTFQVVVIAPPRFSRIAKTSNETLTLTFSIVPGKTHHVEFKNDLADEEWVILRGHIIADSWTFSVTNNTIGNAQRFYRVRQLD